MRIKEMIRTIIKDAFCTNNWGTRCQFFNMGEIGVKLYRCEYSRDGAYENQANYADYDAAPYAYFKFTFKTADETYYCYVTETVEPIADNNDESWDHGEGNIDEWVEEFQEKTGCYYEDTHPANFGIRWNGDVVPLDFDRF